MPFLKQVQKDSAKLTSDAMILEGVRATALGRYKGSRPPPWFDSGALGLLSVAGISGVPLRPQRRLAFSVGFLVTAYVGLLATGVVDALGMLTICVYNWGLITLETYWVNYENLVQYSSSVAVLAEHFQIGGREAGTLTISVLLLFLGSLFAGLGGGVSDSEPGSGEATPDPAMLPPTSRAVPAAAPSVLLVRAITVCRWRQVVCHLRRLRQLQRLFGYLGQALQWYPEGLRLRPRLVDPTWSQRGRVVHRH
jgi:hypothetical protein